MRAGDPLVVAKLDRLGRSLENLIELSKRLEDDGVALVVLDQGIDTSTAIDRMFFQILGAIAEFEHALMSERTMDDLAAARARTGGQKPSSAPARYSWRGRCTRRRTTRGTVATPWRRSPTPSRPDRRVAPGEPRPPRFTVPVTG
ncbi:recombinase family protein [Streptomyces sp. NPDC053048]|uniref:recombinase family protein n=1 Tax=Streptomyces sp. NPDC053048 TaxID=3365694 RepID=UPI0037D54C6A